MKRTTILTLAAAMLVVPVPVLAASPLSGTWVLDGPDPKHNQFQQFTFLRMSFKPGGVFTCRYLPPAPLSLRFLTRNRQEEALAAHDSTMSYDDRGAGKLELRSGASILELRYELRGPTGLVLHLPPVLGEEQPPKHYRKIR